MSPPLLRIRGHAGCRALLAALLLAVPFLAGCTDAGAANETTEAAKAAPARPGPSTAANRPSPSWPVAARTTPPAPAPAAPKAAPAAKPKSAVAPAAPKDATPVAAAQAKSRVNLNATLAQWGLVRDLTAPVGTAIWRKATIGVKVEVRRDKADVLLNGVHVWLSSPVSETGGIYRITRADYDSTFLPVLAPVSALGMQRPKPVRHVFLDPGHGGDDTGCENKALGLKEKTLALDVALRVKFILERRGLKVTLSRTKDVFIGLQDRPAMAKKAGADIYVSIHLNSQGDTGTSVSGVESYVLAPYGQRSTNHSAGSALNTSYAGHVNNVWNTILGYQVQSALTAKLGTPDRGLRRCRLAVIHRATCPAVLVECGFLPNPAEAAKIKLPAHREKIAQGIADGIFRYQKLMESHIAAIAKTRSYLKMVFL